MKGDKELEVYKLQQAKINFCSEEESIDIEILQNFQTTLEAIEIQKVKSMNKSCFQKKKYIPLKHRTWTLKDIRKSDDSENREKAVKI